MTEEEARMKLEEIQNWIRDKDILYTEIKFRDSAGNEYGFVEHHIREIKKQLGKWDSTQAKRHLLILRSQLEAKYNDK